MCNLGLVKTPTVHLPYAVHFVVIPSMLALRLFFLSIAALQCDFLPSHWYDALPACWQYLQLLGSQVTRLGTADFIAHGCRLPYNSAATVAQMVYPPSSPFETLLTFSRMHTWYSSCQNW